MLNQKLLFLLIFIAIGVNSFAQLNPVKWTKSVNEISTSEYELVLTAKIDSSWKLYGIMPDNDEGPISFFYEILDTQNIKKYDTIASKEEPIITYDPVFDIQVRSYKNEVNFAQRVYIKDLSKDAFVKARFEFMAMNDERAIAPVCQEVTFFIEVDHIRSIRIGDGFSDCND